MNAWNLILATVVIFGTGVITGGLLVDHVLHPHPKVTHRVPVPVTATNHVAAETHPTDFNKPKPSEIISQQFVEQLDERLQLAPAQHEAIEKIILGGQEENHSISTNCAAKYRQVVQDVKQKILEQLNPDQIKAFEKLLRQIHPFKRQPASGGGTNIISSALTATNVPAPAATNSTAR